MDDRLWEDYLFHHGIQGQKWGVRNGPPYPLAESNKSAKEKDYSDRIGTIRKVIGAVDLHRDLKTIKNEDKKMFLKDGPKESLKELKKKTQKTTPEDDMSKVMEFFRKNKDEDRDNFDEDGNCALSFEMRRRGYDVRARRSHNNGVNLSELDKKFFKNSNFVKKKVDLDVETADTKAYGDKMYESVMYELKTGSGNNSRGIIWSPFETGKGAKFVNYEIKDNKVTIYDSKNNRKVTQNDFKFMYPTYGYIRTDNSEVKSDITERICSIDNEKRGITNEIRRCS